MNPQSCTAIGSLLLSLSFVALPAGCAAPAGADTADGDETDDHLRTNKDLDGFAAQLELGTPIRDESGATRKRTDPATGYILREYTRNVNGRDYTSALVEDRTQAHLRSVDIVRPGWDGQPVHFTLDGVALDATYTYGLKTFQYVDTSNMAHPVWNFTNGQIVLHTPLPCDGIVDPAEAAACHHHVFVEGHTTVGDLAYQTDRRAGALGSFYGWVTEVRVQNASGFTVVPAPALYLADHFRTKLDKFARNANGRFEFTGGRIEQSDAGGGRTKFQLVLSDGWRAEACVAAGSGYTCQ